MNEHEMLVAAIKARMSEKKTEFNYGILTADRYLDTLQKCVGSDLCYRFAAKGNISFQDMMVKAASTLTYSNEDMTVDDLYSEWQDLKQTDIYGNELVLPKNTLMVFKHTLTSPKKDRDGDILRTEGGRPDPKMLLLFQHTHTLPIGKMLGVAEHTNKRLKMYSAIVDINDLSHDSAVMVDNGMGRFSHGFKALEFEENKTVDSKGKSVKTGGFDIKQFEIMEESLVSVPSNTDAENEEVLLSLVDGRKLTSPIMKSYGKAIREKRPLSVSVPKQFDAIPLDLNIKINGKAIEVEIEKEENTDEDNTPTFKSGSKCGCGCNGAPGGCGGKKPAPEEANADADGQKGTDNKEMSCPECGGKMVGKRCEDCGYTQKSSFAGEKAGRVISSANMEKLIQARDHIKEVHSSEQLMSRGGKSMCKDAHNLIDTVISAATPAEAATPEISVKDAMSIVIAKGSKEEQYRLLDILNSMKEIDQNKQRTKSFQTIFGLK